ncbi:MAG TPA: hypothetical protein VLF93_07945 [Candidatus Saccharimonadales bacterium]|nr:hypothetical protein [Candidatus Saccharimonadales bacterium]
MSNAQHLSGSTLKEITFFKALLFFYPEPYRKRFGEQILILFEDLYQEELAVNGKIRKIFWIMQIADLSKSIFEQHIDFLGKYGLKKYMKQVLRFNKYNALGIFFLLPFLSVFLIDVLSRILQWNSLRPNEFVSHAFYNTPLYWSPILFTWVFLFPILAVIINVVPLIKNMIKHKRYILTFRFFNLNVITIAILGIALSVVALVILHDFAPCFLRSLFTQGIWQIGHIVSVCKNA